MLAVHVARLEILDLAHGGILFVTRIATASVAIVTLTVLVSTISTVASHSVQPVGLVMVHEMTKLVSIALLKFFAHLALRVGSDPLKLGPLIAAIV
jgi:hypothetical protein